ncbi:MAG: GIY-YIG nuclease family protein [Balneola sp.]|nr:GIY-YIG nuclease family protein [Balneola sp.]
MKNWFVYIIRCYDNSLYTGSTNNVIRRWNQHNRGEGAKYLKANTPKEMVYVEHCDSRSLACKREYEIKQFSKKKKEALIRFNNAEEG